MVNEQDYAIVIGIKDYQQLKPLNGPVQDAVDFENWLLNPQGGNLPNHKTDNKVLQHVFFIESAPNSEVPLQSDIDKCLDKVLTNGEKTGYRRFYFFFAGHGLGISWKENALCLPGWSSRFINLALSSSEYLDVVVNSGLFAQVFFFLDCCRDRKLGARGLHPTIGWPKPGEGVPNCESFVAYGAKFNNPAHEAANPAANNEVVNGFFSKALLMGLNGAAVNVKGEITVNSLKSFLKSKVEELTNAVNINQSVQFEDRFNPDSIVVSGLAVKEVAVTISFTEKGDFILEGPLLNSIKEEKNPVNPWNLSLNNGNYSITNKINGKVNHIRIDGTVKPFIYAFK
jgi:Caspase domain